MNYYLIANCCIYLILYIFWRTDNALNKTISFTLFIMTLASAYYTLQILGYITV